MLNLLNLQNQQNLQRSSKKQEASSESLYLRGINLAGGEFTSDADHLPGTYNTDYHYDSLQTIQYLASVGHKVIRVPFRWERIQPTLDAALDTNELARLQTVVSNIRSSGMKAILDVHNYARFINSTANGGATLVLNAGLNNSSLIDLWTRLSTAFKGNSGIYAYGLMNEPNNLATEIGALTGTTVFNWNATAQGWSAESVGTAAQSTAEAYEGAGSLSMSRTNLSNATNQLLRVGDNAGNTMIEANGATLSVMVFVPSSAPGTNWRARIEMQNSSYQWQTGGTYGITKGTWTEIRYKPSSGIWTGHKGVLIQFMVDNPADASATVYVDKFQQGTAAANKGGAQIWEEASQAVLTAIRANSDNTLILVPGYSYSGAQTWLSNHPDGWITDSANNFRYEAHHYFDSNNSGAYNDSYATTNSAAVSGGYANLAARITTEINIFINWLTNNNARGFLGEFGWPNNADTSSWNAIGEVFYDLLDAAQIGATVWSGGEWWGDTYKLSVYVGTPHDTKRSSATIVEAHPTI